MLTFIRDLWDDEPFLVVCIAVIGVAAVYVLFAIRADSREHQRLMAQCQAAGRAEYECVSLLKQDTVPVFIPMPMGR